MNQRENIDNPNVHYEIADPAVMSLTPVVSVHMITYNHGPYLAEAIEGVIAQNIDFPIELVIGEDCSNDNTREIALDYQHRYPHLIRVIYSERNVGGHTNFCRVLEACRGEFVAFCEGDDYWVNPDKLREQVDVLSKFKNIDITFHSCYVKAEKQQTEILSHVHSSKDKVFALSEVIDGDIHFLMGFMPTASIMVRRSLLMSIQDWFDANISPVGDHVIQVFGSRNGAYYVNKPMSVYRTEVAGSWSEKMQELDSKLEMEILFLSMLIRLKQAIPEQEEAFQRRIIYNCSNLLKVVTNNNFAQIKELVLSALKNIYEAETIVEPCCGSEQLEWDYFLRLAGDNAKRKELTDPSCGASWQLLRVAGSLFEYSASVLRMINTSQSESNEYKWTMINWKVEEQRSYLVARWKRLQRMLINA